MLTIAGTALPPETSSVPIARALVGEVADHLPQRAREAAELVVSELATNSVQHAGTEFEVFAAADDETVEVLVADGTGWAAKHKGSRAPGHGLLLVGLLSSEWSAELEGDGKRVWARVRADDIPLY